MNASPESFRRHRLTVAEYRAMGEHGTLAPDARVELVGGEIVDLLPIGTMHAGIVDQLTRLLGRAVGERAIVRVQNPIELPEHSMPQPDLALLRPRDDFYKRLQPGAADTLLVVEVADSSLAHDRDVKLPLYARHGVPAAWLIDVSGARIALCREPGADGYGRIDELAGLGRVDVPGLDGVAVDLSGLLD